MNKPNTPPPKILPKKYTLHEECVECPQRLKKYCTGTMMNMQCLLCWKKSGNGQKYHAMKKRN